MNAPGTSGDDLALADRASRVAFGRLVGSLLELGTFVVLARVLAREELAAFALVYLVYETTKHLATLGLAESVLYFFERLGEASHRAFATRTTSILAGTGLVAGGVLLSLVWLAPLALDGWSSGALSWVRALAPWFAVVVLFEVLVWTTGPMMIASGRARDAAIHQMATSASTLLALVFTLGLGFGPLHAAKALAATAALRLLVSLVWLDRVLPARLARLPSGFLREQLAFSWPLGLSALVGRLNKYLDKYVVAAVLTDSALATFQIGAQELPMITVLPYATGSVLVGRFVALRATADSAGVHALFRRAAEKVSLLVVPLVSFAVVMAPDLVDVLFGAGWSSAVPIFRIYGLILLQRVAQYGAVLQAFGDTRTILKLTVVMLLVNAVASVPATWAFGPTGAALGTLLATLLGWYGYQARIGELLGVRTAAVLSWRHYGMVVAASFAPAMVVAAARASAGAALSAPVALALGIAVYVPLTLAALSALGLATGRDLRTLRRWLSPTFHLG